MKTSKPNLNSTPVALKFHIEKTQNIGQKNLLSDHQFSCVNPKSNLEDLNGHFTPKMICK